MVTQEKQAAPKKNKREWIYARKPAGKLFNYRQVFGYLLLVLLICSPFIKINGEQLFLFNVIDRKFVLFGTVFWPQDMHIFVFGMLIAMVCIVLFTVVYGRVWCGWACPQTIFMELIFRRIEYWIEGDAHQQKKADNGPQSRILLVKKAIKHLLFFLISFAISNIFLAYIIGTDQLIRIITDPVSAHIAGLGAILLFTLVFYAVFAYVREIVCTTICPYGRLQGVLLDEQSITVAYDYKRGEPRGHRNREEQNSSIGDCVDCGLCVQVCPTGIDIRNGIQLECVNCTACIDACDAVMDKVQRPRKLIGFFSTRDIEDKTTKRTNTRAIAYTAVLVALMGVFTWLLLSRTETDSTLLRAKGSSYQFRPDSTVSNLYNLELINKSNRELSFTLEPEDERIQLQLVNPIHTLKKEGTAQLSFFLISRPEYMSTYKTNVKIKVVSEGRILETLKTTFIAPPGG